MEIHENRLALKGKIILPENMEINVAVSKPSVGFDKDGVGYHFKYKLYLSFDGKEFLPFDFGDSVSSYNQNIVANTPKDAFDMLFIQIKDALDYQNGYEDFISEFGYKDDTKLSLEAIGIFKWLGNTKTKIDSLNKDTKYNLEDLYIYLLDIENSESKLNFVEDTTITAIEEKEFKPQSEIIDFTFDYQKSGFVPSVYDIRTNEFKAEKITDIYDLNESFNLYDEFISKDTTALRKYDLLGKLYKNSDSFSKFTDGDKIISFLENITDVSNDEAIILKEDLNKLNTFFGNIESELEKEYNINIRDSEKYDNQYINLQYGFFSANSPKAYFLENEPTIEQLADIAKNNKDVHILELSSSEDSQFIAVVKDATLIDDLKLVVKKIDNVSVKIQDEEEINALDVLIGSFDELEKKVFKEDTDVAVKKNLHKNR